MRVNLFTLLMSGPDGRPSDPHLERLRADLMVAAHNMVKRRRRRRRIGATSILATAVVGLLGGVFVWAQPSGASPIEVERTGSVAEVRLDDLTASPDAIATSLRAEGINAQVQAVPVADPMIGEFVSLQTRNIDPNYSIIDQQGGGRGFTAFRITPGLDSEIELEVGRAAKPGENYQTAYSAYEPGGVLACSGLWGAPLGTAAPVLQSLHRTIVWRLVDSTGTHDISPSDYPTYHLVETQEMSPTMLIAMVTQDGKPVYLTTKPPAACNGSSP